MVLESSTWIANVVGKISEWIDLDNPSANIRRQSEEALKQVRFHQLLALTTAGVLLGLPPGPSSRALPDAWTNLPELWEMSATIVQPLQLPTDLGEDPIGLSLRPP
jgi:hypothetical protein